MLKSPLRNAIPFCALAAVLFGGCGDDSTGPSTPNVAGTYVVTGSIEAATCTPRQLPAGGTVILEAFKFEDFGTLTHEIQQNGSQLIVRERGYPGRPYTGTVEEDGNIRFGAVVEFTEQPRQGSRVFRVTLTEDWKLQREDGGNRLRGTASFVNVFREGQSTEVFTTCSRGATPTLTPIGG